MDPDQFRKACATVPQAAVAPGAKASVKPVVRHLTKEEFDRMKGREKN